MRKIFTLLVLSFITVQFVSAQTVIRDEIVNFSELAAYEAAHPELFKPCPTCPRKEADGGWEGIYNNGNMPVPPGANIKMAPPIPKRQENQPMPMVPSRSPSQQWLGHVDPGSIIPPDTYGAVGLNHVIDASNDFIRIQNKTGGGVVSSVSVSSFTGVGSTCDPQMFFDPSTQRWIACFIRCTGSNDQVIVMCSNTADPTGTWRNFQFIPVAGGIPDHPYLGYDDTKIIIGARKFNPSFTGPDLYIIDKAAFLAGTPITFGTNAQTISKTASDGDCPRPVTVYFPPYSTVGNPSPGTFYILQSWSNNSLRLTTVTGNIPSCVWNTGSAVFPTAPDSWTAGNMGNSIPQQAPETRRIAANDARISSAVMMNGKIWASHHIAFPAGASGTSITSTDIQYWCLDGAPGTLGTVIQRGRTGAATGEHRWFSSIAVNKNEDVLIGYSMSNATNMWPSAAYSTRQVSTPPNTLDDPLVYHAGEGRYWKDFGSGRTRWGDYSQSHLDPVNNSLWTIQEYASTPAGAIPPDNNSRYGTWWAQVPATTPTATPVIVAVGSPVLVSESCVPANGVVDPGETVTMAFTLQNVGTAPTVNAVGTLQASGGIVPSGPAQNYGVIVNGGPSVTRNFTFTNTSSICGSTITPSIQVQDGASNLGTVAFPNISLGLLSTTLLPNGGFETGSLAPWVVFSGTPAPVVNATSPRTGTFAAFLGNLPGSEPNGDCSMYQQFTVPAGGGILSFWYKGYTEDGITFDWQDAYITNTSNTILATIMHVCNTNNYTQVTYNLAAFAGQTVRLRFLVHQDGFGDVTNMYVDDVAISQYTCCGTPCVLTCPANITVNSNPNLCGANVTFAASVSGLCGNVVYSPASGSLFPIGTTTVTATAAAGNTCTFTVTVVDNIPPVITCPANITVGNTPGLCSAVVNYPLPVATDNCTPNGTVSDFAQPWTNSGQRGVFFDVQNISGSTFSIVRLNPAIWATGNLSETYSVYVTTSATTWNGNQSNPTAWTLNTTAPVTFPGGANPIQVAVPLTTPITLAPGQSKGIYILATAGFGGGPNAYLSTAAGYAGPQSYQDANLKFTGGIGSGDAFATFFGSGNPGDFRLYYGSVTYSSGLPVTLVSGPASGSVFPVGTTPVTYSATDGAGNSATCTFNVTVNDTQAPTITCPANQVRTTDANQCYATFTPPVPTYSDNCGVTRLTWSITGPGGFSANSPGTGINTVPSTQFPLNGTTGVGVSTVTYTIYDAAGNQSTCSFTVTVNDGQIPVIQTPPSTKFFCAGSNGVFSVTATTNGGPLSYQWQEWNGTAWANIAGATSSSFTVPAVTFADNTRSFRVILTGRCSVVTSPFATLYVNPLPTVSLITSIPPSLVPGQSLTITANASPAGGTYAWYKNGTLTGNTGSTWPGITVDGIGTYKVTYTDANGCSSTSSDLVISGQASDNLWVYPNPNNGQFTVRFFNTPNETATVSVFDAKGAKVYEKANITTIPYTGLAVDLGPTIASGTYVVVVNNSAGKKVGAKRIVVRRKP